MIAGLVSLFLAAASPPGAVVSPTFVEQQLKRLAADFTQDPMMIDVTFGVEVDGQVWTIDATPAADGRRASVTVTKGEPKVPTWVDTMSGDVFRRIIEGRMSAYTASVRARASDKTLLNHRFVNGLREEELPVAAFRSVLAHFWVTGQPEMIPYGWEGSKEAHGAQVSVLHYGDQLRSGWWGILPGQHVNKDPADQANPFPTMFIVEKAGTAVAKIGGKLLPLRDRTMIMVPPDVTHEFWNPGDKPAEGFIIMFGKGA